MIAFILAGQNLPFTSALAIMFAIALLEGIALLFGAGISSLLDALVPDAHIDPPEIQSNSALSGLLGWLRIGQVPVLMLLVIFLTGFGLLGLGIQALSDGLFGFLLPAPIAAIPALLLALPVVRVGGGVLQRVMPQDETEAVSEDTFIGRVAVITLGRARAGEPAQAKLKDHFGQVHYVMVEPDTAGDIFETGANVLLVKQLGAVFRAIRATNGALVG